MFVALKYIWLLSYQYYEDASNMPGSLSYTLATSFIEMLVVTISTHAGVLGLYIVVPEQEVTRSGFFDSAAEVPVPKCPMK